MLDILRAIQRLESDAKLRNITKRLAMIADCFRPDDLIQLLDEIDSIIVSHSEALELKTKGRGKK